MFLLKLPGIQIILLWFTEENFAIKILKSRKCHVILKILKKNPGYVTIKLGVHMHV